MSSNVVNRDVYQNNQYYNISIGGQESNTAAIFRINRVEEILYDPSDYVLSVASFTIPLFSVPLFDFNDEGDYKIILEYNGTSVLVLLEYVPEGIGPPIIAEQPVFSYQAMLQSFNEAFQKAFDELKLLEPLMPATTPPVVTLRDSFLSINAEAAYLSNLPNDIRIIMNRELANFFSSIPSFYISSSRVQFLIQDLYTNSFIKNGLTYYKMEEATNQGLSNWGKLNRILLETASIPINRELIGTQNNITISAISDFNVLPDNNRPLDLTYNPFGAIRISDLNSSYPLKQIDVNIRWFSEDGSSKILILPPGKRADIKLRFTRRRNIDLNNIVNTGVNF
jgi:hypothetical protein